MLAKVYTLKYGVGPTRYEILKMQFSRHINPRWTVFHVCRLFKRYKYKTHLRKKADVRFLRLVLFTTKLNFDQWRSRKFVPSARYGPHMKTRAMKLYSLKSFFLQEVYPTTV